MSPYTAITMALLREFRNVPYIDLNAYDLSSPRALHRVALPLCYGKAIGRFDLGALTGYVIPTINSMAIIAVEEPSALNHAAFQINLGNPDYDHIRSPGLPVVQKIHNNIVMFNGLIEVARMLESVSLAPPGMLAALKKTNAPPFSSRKEDAWSFSLCGND